MINEREIQSLIKLFDDPDPQIFNHIEDKLLSYGNEVISYLEDAWENLLMHFYKNV